MPSITQALALSLLTAVWAVSLDASYLFSFEIRLLFFPLTCSSVLQINP